VDSVLSISHPLHSHGLLSELRGGGDAAPGTRAHGGAQTAAVSVRLARHIAPSRVAVRPRAPLPAAGRPAPPHRRPRSPSHACVICVVPRVSSARPRAPPPRRPYRRDGQSINRRPLGFSPLGLGHDLSPPCKYDNTRSRDTPPSYTAAPTLRAAPRGKMDLAIVKGR
jgi:hypothetical protein